MGLELARAFVTIRSDASGLPGDLASVREEVNSALKDISAGAASILAPFALFGQGVIQQGLAAASYIETTTVELETLTGSATETKDILERLTKFAVQTPFEMPQLLQVSRGLVQANVRGDELMSTLKMLGDASSGSAEKFSVLAIEYEQAMNNGRMYHQDFRRLSNRGVLSVRDLAKAFNISAAEAEKMSRNMSFEKLKEALEKLTGEGGKYHDGMLLNSTTMAGLNSTLNDSIRIAKQLLAEPLLPYLKALTTGYINLANVISGFIKDGGEVVSFAFVGATAFARLGAAVTVASFAMRLFGISIRKAIIGTGVGLAIIALGAAIGALVGYFEVPKKLAEGFEWLKKKLFGNGVALKNAWLAFENIKKAAVELWPMFVKLGEAVLKLSGTFLGMHGVIFRMWNLDLFANGLAAGILKLSEFALDMSEWFLAISMHWDTLWKSFPAVVAISWSIVTDIMTNALQMAYNSIMSGVAKIIDAFYMMQAEIGIAMETLNQKMQGRDVNPAWVKRMRDSAKVWSQEAKNAMGISSQVNTDIMKISDRTKKLMETTGVGKIFTDIMKTKKELEAKRGLKPGEEPTKEGADKKKAVEAAPDFLKAGSTEISKFGTSIQDLLLQSKDDKVDKTNSLLEQGNKMQEEQLKESKKQKTGAILG